MNWYVQFDRFLNLCPLTIRSITDKCEITKFFLTNVGKIRVYGFDFNEKDFFLQFVSVCLLSGEIQVLFQAFLNFFLRGVYQWGNLVKWRIFYGWMVHLKRNMFMTLYNFKLHVLNVLIDIFCHWINFYKNFHSLTL